MELEKRVENMETEIKVVKGEIKELLVDIRDLINKSENPFYNNHKRRISIPETRENEVEAVNEKSGSDKEESDLKPCEGGSEMSRQINSINEMQAIEPEIPIRKIDAFTLVELMRWVDYAIRTVGRSNLEVVLELYSLTGQLSEETKYVIRNIAKLSTEEPECEDEVSMKDNITVLSQLYAILNPSEFKIKKLDTIEDSSWRADRKGRSDLLSSKCTN